MRADAVQPCVTALSSNMVEYSDLPYDILYALCSLLHETDFHALRAFSLVDKRSRTTATTFLFLHVGFRDEFGQDREGVLARLDGLLANNHILRSVRSVLDMSLRITLNRLILGDLDSSHLPGIPTDGPYRLHSLTLCVLLPGSRNYTFCYNLSTWNKFKRPCCIHFRLRLKVRGYRIIACPPSHP
jgi:hypothetical protein